MRTAVAVLWTALGSALLLTPATPLVAQDSSPHISLLSSGTRASVVIELDGTGAKATAIEATDNQSVAVEIGPVHGKVANQRLQAGAASALVSEVRVRGVTQGTDGTIITIQVLAKAPVIGSVRRAQRRVYIDLERREPRGLTPGTDQVAAVPNAPVPAAPAAKAPAAATPVPATPKATAAPVSPPAAVAPKTVAAAPAPAKPSPTPPSPTTPSPTTPSPVKASASSATPATSTTPATVAASAPVAAAPVTTAKTAVPAVPAPAQAPAAVQPRPGAPARTEAAPAAVLLPPPRTAAGSLTPSNAPSTSTPGVRSTRAPASTSTPPTAPVPSGASTAAAAPAPAPAPAPVQPAAPPVAGPAPAPAVAAVAAVARENKDGDDLLKKGSVMAQQSDVKGLERLKQTAVARLGEGTTELEASKDPIVSQLDRLLNDARQQRLMADAELFRRQSGIAPTTAAPRAAAPANVPANGSTTGAVSQRTQPAPAGPAPASSAPASRPATAPAAGRSPASSELEAVMTKVMPDVERMRDTLSSWQPGYLASPTLPPQINELNAKLHAVPAPTELASSIAGLSSALTELSSTWVPGPDGKLIPFRDDVRAVERTKTALRNFIDAAAALKLTQGR